MENIIERQDELKQEVMVAAKADITVVDQATYAAANNLIGRLQGIRKEVVARFADPKKKAAELLPCRNRPAFSSGKSKP